MLPDPLHPAVVHFPIVLMTFLPFMAFGALWAIRRGAAPMKAWAFPVGAAALLVISAFVSLKTGEAQEERAEDRVAESAIQAHEEAAEQFMLGSGVVLIIMAVGLTGTAVGRTARVLGTAGALALVIAGVRVGHSGGGIVYGNNGQPGMVSGLAAAEGDGPAQGKAEKERESGEDRD